MSSPSDLVTTIIPVFNRPHQLRAAFASVLLQDHRPFEIIVVDDGSTDETPDVVRALVEAHPAIAVRLRQDNAGPGAARELGRRYARGAFLQYLDSDDLLLPGKFTAQVAALSAQPECAVAYGLTRFVHADGTAHQGPWKGSGTFRKTMFPSFLAERWWDTPNPLYRRNICELAGPWTGLRIEEDWEYDCRIAALGARLAWVEQYVCEVHDHAGPRLSRGSANDRARSRDRAKSHLLILSHAQRAGLSTDLPEMQHFSRALFLLARQCGAAGLPQEARELFDAARQACGPRAARRPAFIAYAAAAAVAGWTNAGRLACAFDGWRREAD